MTAPERPMLRPLGVGDMIDAVFTIIRARPLLFLVVAAVPQLIYSLAARGAGFADTSSLARLRETLQDSSATGTVPDVRPEDLANAVTLGIGLALLAIVIFTVQSGAIVDAVSRRYLGDEVTARDALTAALRAAPRLIGAGLLAFVGVLALMLVFVVVFIVLVALGTRQAGALAAIAGVGAFVALFVSLFFVAASWTIAPVVVMREHAGPVTALRRSWWLSSGSRWRILGVLLLLLVLQAVVSTLFSVLFLAAVVTQPTATAVLQTAADVATASVIGALQWGTFAVLYYDLRVRREAFDLQLAAEALPREG